MREGKDTFAGIKDPVLAKAKPAFDAGLIQSADDFRALVNAGYDAEWAQLTALEASRRMTLEQAYPDLDHASLLPGEPTELEAAQRGVEKANQTELAFNEVSMCLKSAGA